MAALGGADQPGLAEQIQLLREQNNLLVQQNLQLQQGRPAARVQPQPERRRFLEPPVSYTSGEKRQGKSKGKEQKKPKKAKSPKIPKDPKELESASEERAPSCASTFRVRMGLVQVVEGAVPGRGVVVAMVAVFFALRAREGEVLDAVQKQLRRATKMRHGDAFPKSDGKADAAHDEVSVGERVRTRERRVQDELDDLKEGVVDLG
mmetsp:Transcript_9685/g.21890  ORF Transcript_9685/g.21890 Transcript_9685/m.21890 type:complete len:206 (-) Transcript_9685:535-1152(-)|eukprot:CAMPEP_0206125114 /NCGR_PEP_ID=MMETSP1472-20131121/15594_1 /ASSEMBLY_ACC=CAM_ASM_001108 /TAXON_ID=41880 /ORGANISM="Pycnococcus provasolii, Strain RCC251" /LENGTH=205 /DNA_ID=CAMNT_0053515977 /DNA_START=174 /DNA_END=791 /DNA_ORIENTATION=-